MNEATLPNTAGPVHTWLWPFVIVAATALIYLPGLNGPFLFDDFTNLVGPLNDWISGLIGWQEIVFGNGSGPLGRVISMASFMANAAISGLDPFAYKIVNLGIHLTCGILIYLLIKRLLALDTRLIAGSQRLALLIAALWLVHPIQVSTVLYIVQRMAQLSTLFTLLALLIYVIGRQRLEQGQTRRALIWLFVGLPTVTILAVFSKENGALVPLLCAVIEFGFFQSSKQLPRSNIVKTFFLILLLIPGLLAAIWIVLHPQLILAGYEDRAFTLGERLLTEPRVLMDYLGALLIPQGPALGIYTDDFPVSLSLFDPWTTLASIIALLGIAITAIIARKGQPLIFSGIAFFLAAHVMESTVFPLEIYFEHRNYLPSLGYFMALVGTGTWLFTFLKTHTKSPLRMQKWLGSGAVALVLLFGLATIGRAGIWSSFALIATQGAEQHPNSLRAQMDYANILQKMGKPQEVQRIFDKLATMDNLEARHAAAINSVTLQCMISAAAPPESIERINQIAGDDLRTFDMMNLANLADFIATNECKGLTKQLLANSIVSILDASDQPQTFVQIWRSRFNVAKLLVRSGDVAGGREQLELAWRTGAADPAVGVFLAEVQLSQQDMVAAKVTVSEVRSNLAWWDRRGATLLTSIEERIRNLEERHLPETPHPATNTEH